MTGTRERIASTASGVFGALGLVLAITLGLALVCFCLLMAALMFGWVDPPIPTQ